MKTFRETDYLITACCDYIGLDESCYELTQMKRLGCDLSAKSPSGFRLMSAYRELAPDLVNRINISDKRDELLKFGFNEIKEIVRLADEGDEKAAAAHCVYLVLNLEEKLRD